MNIWGVCYSNCCIFMLYSLSRRRFLIHYDQHLFVCFCFFKQSKVHLSIYNPHNPHAHTYKHNSLENIVARLG